MCIELGSQERALLFPVCATLHGFVLLARTLCWEVGRSFGQVGT